MNPQFHSVSQCSRPLRCQPGFPAWRQGGLQPRAQQGFVIVTAIFILVVLTALGAFILNVSTMQHAGSLQDVQSARAYQAARSGLEWGMYQINRVASAASRTAGTACPAAKNLAASPAFPGFSVRVECDVTLGGNGEPTVYRIRATACNQPNAAGAACPNVTNPNSLYVERQLEVLL